MPDIRFEGAVQDDAKDHVFVLELIVGRRIGRRKGVSVIGSVIDAAA